MRFIHLQKCAGTTIGAIIKKYNGSLNGHSTISEKGDELIIGNIRNPFDVYVSLWAFGCTKKGVFYRYFANHHKEHIHLYDDPYNIHNFQEWLRLILQYKIHLPRIEHFQDTTIMKTHKIGLLTYRFFALYNKHDYSLLNNPTKDPFVDIFIRAEHMVEDLAKIGIQYNGEKINTTKHLDSGKYYNDELKALVYDRDRYIFQKFGY